MIANKIVQGFQLSPQQKHLWLLQANELSQPYRCFCAIQIEGNLNIEALKKALYNIINRHDILRTNFDCLPGMAIPLQVIADTSIPLIHEYDLRDLEPQLQQNKINDFCQEARHLSLDFNQGSLLHISLVTLSLSKYILLVSLPALCADKTALKNFVREISQAYKAYLYNQELSDEPIQYILVSTWQNELIASEEAAVGREYWQKKNIPHYLTLKLPFEKQPSAKSKFNPQIVTQKISSELTLKLETLVEEYNTSTSSLLLACWQILLWHLTGQSGIMVGIACDGRIDEELAGVLGLLTKYIPIHCELEENLEFREVLKRVDEAKLAAQEWQECFVWEQILGTEAHLSNSPFFPFCFEFEEQFTELSTAELSFSIYKQYACFDKFKIKISLIRNDDSLLAEFHYDSEFLSTEDIQRTAGQFHTLLESVIQHPKAVLNELEILSNTERQQLLIEFNNTKIDYPKNKCLHQLFEEQVERTANNIAVVFEEQHLTYAELNAQANQLAHYLQRLGVEPDVLVGICIERSLLMVIAQLAVLKAGGAYLPLDPAYPKERLSWMLEDSETLLVLTTQQLAENLPLSQKYVIYLDSTWEVLNQESEENPVSEVEADNLAYVIYTSGSTGKPKGVAIAHQAICNHMFWMQTSFPLKEADKVLQKTPFSFDASVWEFYAPLLAGAQLVMAQPGGHQDSVYLVQTIADKGITVLQLVPTLLQMLLKEKEIETCRSLKRIFCGGEALSVALQEEVFAHLDVELHNLYGPTEACIDSTYWTCKREAFPQIIPIGRPIANTQIYILNAQLQPVPIGVKGEAYIGGTPLARGYLNRPGLTREKFLPNPFIQEEGARIYKTGDLARYLPDGNIEFLGRIDHQIKIRGFRIELGEIEAVLAEHFQVQEAVVIAREDQPGSQRLVGYVIPKEEPPTTTDLRRFLMQKLPEYMVPSVFVMLQAFPLTQNGKVDRRALPAPPDSSQITRGNSFVPPRTPTEKILADIWAGILGLEAVSIHDNFFELGGDSIVGIRVIAQANQAGLQLVVKQLFQYQTIAELATVVTPMTATLPQAEQGVVTGQVPLTPIQHWFFAQKQSEPHHYNQSLLLEVSPDSQPQTVEEILQHLLRQHDALRLRFELSDVGWQQVNVAFDEICPFSAIDLSEVPSEEQLTALELAAARLQASLNLTKGPLLRVVLFRLGSDRPARLLLIVHHLAIDGVSWRILLEDLVTAYQQISCGEAIQLPSKTTSFKDWAHRLTTYGQSEALTTELDYWVAQSRSQIAHLPIDYPQGKEVNTVASSASVSVSLNEEQTQSLLVEVPSAYNTQINDVLLTALAQSLQQWTGKSTFLVDLEGHGREELFEDVDLSRTVGWFTTVFPVLLELDTDQPGQALKSIKEELRRVPKRGIGYGLLRYISQDTAVRGQLQALHQAEIGFNYLGQFDRVLPKSDFVLGLGNESSGSVFSPQGKRNYLLEVNGVVISGRLQMEWIYSENVHKRDTVERLAWSFIEKLQDLIAHCQSTDAGGYTLSDFPLANLNEEKLKKITNLLNQIEVDEN
ncbi:hypothetical protein NUACC21_21420 [Scytonema sp. NUACC21]